MDRILVAGELNADLVMTGLPSLPVLGRELTGTGFHIALGSSSAIAAARMAALGAQVGYVGLLGDDSIGELVIRELRQFGVDTTHIQVVPGKTTDVTIALTYATDRALLTYCDLMTRFDGGAITPELLAEYSHLHVSSFFLQSGLQSHLPRLFRLAHEMNLSTSLDPGWDPRESWMDNPHLGATLAETDFFLPNESETTALCGGTWNPGALGTHVRGVLVVKRGAQGALAVRKTALQDQIAIPAIPVEVVDTTGAGDAFDAGFLYATVILQRGLRDALRFAAACGAQSVTQVGGATNAPSAALVETWLGRFPDDAYESRP
jgi:sugar/nucleoside kinase (ribokinase family)